MLIGANSPQFDQHLSILCAEHMTAQVVDSQDKRTMLIARPGFVISVYEATGATLRGKLLTRRGHQLFLLGYPDTGDTEQDQLAPLEVYDVIDVVQVSLLSN